MEMKKKPGKLLSSFRRKTKYEKYLKKQKFLLGAGLWLAGGWLLVAGYWWLVTGPLLFEI